MHSHKPPALRRMSAAAGRLGTLSTAPGHDVTMRATAVIASMPQLIGTSASASRCSGMSRHAIIAHGITQKPVIGTAIALATTE